VPSSSVTQSTLTVESEIDGTNKEQTLVVRWVFPEPVLEPTWLVAPKTTFGRDETSDVRLEGGYVSRQHAVITRSGPLWIASDLSSKNGIAVNAQSVRESVLSPGDVVRFGNFVGVCMQAPIGSDLSSVTLAPGIFGGRTLRLAFEHMLELARTDLSVVLVGETGAGKESFARALHRASGRSGPFRAVNCSVYSKSMAAAELFGYRKGAFTSADSPSIGHIRGAEGGTLLLDELTELAPDVQAMLLRALENREVMPLGEARPVGIDVRFLAAAQSRLDVAVQAGTLRADLRARLEGGVIALPPLREYREVVVEMFQSLFEAHTGRRPEFRTAAAECLCLYDWPLNVRELDTVVRRVAAGARDQVIDGDAIERALGTPGHGRIRSTAPPSGDPEKNGGKSVYPVEDLEALMSALGRFQGNLSKAASALGLGRTKAYRMLRAAKQTASKSKRTEKS
jgi:transcriptional regulator of acetoin/glycerol metabolism